MFKILRRIFRKYIRSGDEGVSDVMRLRDLPEFLGVIENVLESDTLTTSQLRRLLIEMEYLNNKFGIEDIGEKSFKTYILKEDCMKKDVICSVCLVDYKLGDEVSETKCGHIFHTECLKNWKYESGIKFHCPNCRTNL